MASRMHGGNDSNIRTALESLGRRDTARNRVWLACQFARPGYAGRSNGGSRQSLQWEMKVMAKGNQSPAFQFSEWMRWADCSRHDGINQPGVYLLGKFDSPPPTISCLDKNVIYVGETVDQSLEKRLNQFSRSAFSRKYGHSGGWTFSDDFLSGIKQDQAPPWLFVALLPVSLDEPHRSAIYTVRRTCGYLGICSTVERGPCLQSEVTSSLCRVTENGR